MKVMSAKDAKNTFGHLLDTARAEPVSKPREYGENAAWFCWRSVSERLLAMRWTALHPNRRRKLPV